MTDKTPLVFGFRRRCAWCARVLRAWQLNLCRVCAAAVYDAGMPILTSPPVPRLSMADAPPDTWRRP